MTLIISIPRPETDMTRLMILALQFVYDLDHMDPQDALRMKHGIIAWDKYFRKKKDMGGCRPCAGTGKRFMIECEYCGGKGYEMSEIDQELMHSLQDIAFLIKNDQEGKLDKRKAMFKEHGINYLKFHRVPGVVTAQDRHKAQQALEKAKKANPEDYE